MRLLSTLKIRDKLTILLLFVSLSAIVIATILSLATIYQARRANVFDLLSQLNSHMSDRVEKFLLDKIETFHINVVDPGVNRITEDQGTFILKTLLSEDESITEASFLGNDGQEVVKISRAQQFRKEDLVNQKALPKYTVPIQNKDFIGDIYRTPAGIMLTLASPVVNQEGKIIAILTGEISLKPVEDMVMKASLGKTGYFTLFTANGRILFSSGAAMREYVQKHDQYPINLDIFKDPNVFAGRSSTINQLGQKVIVAGKIIPTLNWIALAQWPTDDAFSVVRSLIFQIIGALIILSIILVVISRLLATRITKPLETLKAGTTQVGKGKFGFQIFVKTGDELEELARNFNAMSMQLKDLVAKIVEEQKKVAQAKDEFVFIAAHELRSPVAVIKGYLSMLDDLKSSLSVKIKENLEQIKGANDRLVQLVSDLLEVARSEAGRMEVKVAPTDVITIAKELSRQYLDHAKRQKVALIYEPPTASPQVMADPNRFKEILGNLIDNGIKYNKPGGTATVTQKIEGQFLVTSVADTGFGISPENLKKLFSKFFRAQEKGTENITGTGLGLWITKELVERMGGKITVESQLSKGTTFTFSLPLAK